MKKFFLILIVVLIGVNGIGILTGCNNSNSLNLQIVEVGNLSNYNDNILGNKVIKSYESLQSFIFEYSNYFNLSYKTSKYTTFIKSIEGYNSNFFKNKYLALYIKEDAVTYTTSYKLQKSKVENNILNIYIKNPSSNKASPAFCFLIFVAEIEVENSNVYYNFV